MHGWYAFTARRPPRDAAWQLTPARCLFRPATCGRDDHADAWHGYQVAGSGEPGVRPRGGLAGDAESLGQLVTGRYSITGRPLPGPDLSLDDPRDLEVPRDA